MSKVRTGDAQEWSLQAISPPWGEGIAIYEHIKSHLPEEGCGLLEGVCPH